MFSDFFSDELGLGADEEFIPQISVHEDKDQYEVTAELAGMNEEDIEIDIDDRMLTLKGEKHAEDSHQRGDRHFCERRYGAFVRTIPLPQAVERDKVSARFKNGLLCVTLPKTDEAKKSTKRIPIKH